MSQAPAILRRADHGISRRDISTAALKVLYGLKDAGYAAYLVGGAVRDLLVGGNPKDFDIATDATPDEVRRIFRSCRLVGRRFVIAHVRFSGEIIEVTTFRGHGGDDEVLADREVVDGQLRRDNVFGSMEEDAQRRDFTVNALYYNIADFSVIDHVGALADLQAKVLRLIGDAETRFREDPVRMLRAARLKAKLGFVLAPDLPPAIEQLRPLLAQIPPARLFDEFCKLFLTGHGLASLEELETLRLMESLFPMLYADGEPTYDAQLFRVCLASTDARVAADLPVTPGFLLAALSAERVEARTAGLPPGPGWGEAAEAAIHELCERVALPRRFTAIAREILELQPRFLAPTAARVRRLLTHPRLRAAYDFLLLRSQCQPEFADLAAFWQAVVDGGAAPEVLLAQGVSSPTTAMPAEAAKRRRRRRGGNKVKTEPA